MSIFNGIFDTDATTVVAVTDFLLCVVIALVIGVILAAMSMFKTKLSKSFVITEAVLPAVVCVIIMMVNGNIGAGVAVAGAFSLIRFRSAPGSAKEITMIFLGMGAGLLCGMGYLAYAVLFAVILGAGTMLFTLLSGNMTKLADHSKILKITIYEDLDYTEAFNDILAKYTSSYELESVKTTNMGSLFKLKYDVNIKDPKQEKAMIDELRTRNGNLEISLSRQDFNTNEL